MNEIRTVTKNMRLSQWADVIRDCKASGLTIAAYCREHNISRNAYFYWQREIKKAAIAEAGNLFAEVEPAACALPVQMPQTFEEGILVTDGYQVYHKLANERPDELKVAGCWAHCKRKFDDVVKTAGKETPRWTISAEAHKRISTIYHVDNMSKGKSSKERLDNRQQSVKPLVDSFFSWLKSIDTTVMDKGGALYGAIRYALNQEIYLRRFLEDAIIPLDNNDAERSIKKFCVGKHSWHIISSRRGAAASAILYSIAETSRANGLKPFEYLKYLLESILVHLDDNPADYIDELMPWSEKLPEYCRVNKFE